MMHQDWLGFSSHLDKHTILENQEIQKASNMFKYLRTEEDVASDSTFTDLYFAYSSLLDKLFI